MIPDWAKTALPPALLLLGFVACSHARKIQSIPDIDAFRADFSEVILASARAQIPTSQDQDIEIESIEETPDQKIEVKYRLRFVEKSADGERVETFKTFTTLISKRASGEYGFTKSASVLEEMRFEQGSTFQP